MVLESEIQNISISLSIQLELTQSNMTTFPWSHTFPKICCKNEIFRVRINISWFFIFHDTVFPSYPENHNTKEGFCFLNRGTKTKFFLAGKVKNDFQMVHISFLLKQLCSCCLDIIHLIYRFFFFLCIDILRIVLQLLNFVLNLCIINNYIVASHLM